MVRDNRPSAYLLGAICSESRGGAAMITSRQHRGNESASGGSQHAVTAGAQALLVCDGAGWYQRGWQLVVPDNIAILTLPAYSSELNPMENV